MQRLRVQEAHHSHIDVAPVDAAARKRLGLHVALSPERPHVSITHPLSKNWRHARTQFAARTEGAIRRRDLGPKATVREEHSESCISSSPMEPIASYLGDIIRRGSNPQKLFSQCAFQVTTSWRRI
ncbi:hypothetical protein MRX96_008877 [Rhipicephalus microplus]